MRSLLLVKFSDEHFDKLVGLPSGQLDETVGKALTEYFERHPTEQPEEPVSVTYQEGPDHA